MATLLRVTQRLPFQLLLHRGVGDGATPFPRLLHFTLDTYLKLLSVKQGGIKYNFLSLWYDLTWDWTPASQTVGKHSTHKANGPLRIRVLNTKETTLKKINITFIFPFCHGKYSIRQYFWTLILYIYIERERER